MATNDTLGEYSRLKRLAEDERVFSAVGAAGSPCRIQRFSLKAMTASEQSEVVDALRRDTATVVGLNDSSIVAFSDVFRDGDDVVVVSEPLSGVSLDAFLVDARGEVDAETAWYVLHAIARAMNLAHGATDAAGDIAAVCHGHLAPRRIRLHSDGRVVVAGLGLASLVGSEELAAETAYQAPEQRKGGRITPRGDIYSIASIAWMMLCGRPPGEPANFEEVAGKLPESLKDCFSRSLQASPALRRMTTMDLEHQLAEAVDPVGKQHLAVAVASLEARGEMASAPAFDDDLDGAATMMFGASDDGPTALVEDAATMARSSGPASLHSSLPPLRSKLPTLRGGTEAVKKAEASALSDRPPKPAADEDDLESTVVMDVSRLKEAAAQTQGHEDKGPPSSELNWGDDSLHSTIAIGEDDFEEAADVSAPSPLPVADLANEESIRVEIPAEALQAGAAGPESVGGLSWSDDDDTSVLANDVASALDAMQSGPPQASQPPPQAIASGGFAMDATVAFDEESDQSPLDDPRVLPRRGPESGPPRGSAPPKSSGLPPPRKKLPEPSGARTAKTQPSAAVASEGAKVADLFLSDEKAASPLSSSSQDSPVASQATGEPLPMATGDSEPAPPESAAAASSALAADSPPSTASAGPASAGLAKAETSPWGGGKKASDTKKDKPISALATVALIVFAMAATMGGHILYTIYVAEPALTDAPPPEAAKATKKKATRSVLARKKKAVKPVKKPAATTSAQPPAASASASSAPAASASAASSAPVPATPSAAPPAAPPAAPSGAPPATPSAVGQTTPPAAPVAAEVPKGKGSELPPDQGYLVVLFNGEHGGAVFFKRKMMGPVNQPIKAPCKDAHWVRIGKMPGPRWLSKGTTIRVKCQSVTKKFVSPQ